MSTEKTAERKVAELLAKRLHSEQELRQKLAAAFSEDEIDEALTKAIAKKWLPKPEEIAERTATSLGAKGKSHHYITQYLTSKGLPTVACDADEEIRKARDIVRSKLDKDRPFDYEEKRKIFRLLAQKGFDDATISEVTGLSVTDSSVTEEDGFHDESRSEADFDPTDDPTFEEA